MRPRSLSAPALLASLVAAGCSPQRPAVSEDLASTPPHHVTLATFEGEIDPDAGTLVVRPTNPAGTSAGPSAALVIPTGPGTLTITNAGTPAPNVDGTGGCSGQKVLSAPVRITLDYPSPGFAGALYAEILTLSGTGAESCNNATPPTGSGLSASKGLWSYGQVQPGTTTSDQTWQFKWTAGQKTTFTGRVVGVAGTYFDLSTATPACQGGWNSIIAYTRASSAGADRMAYAVRGSSNAIAFLDLAGGSHALESVTAPQPVTSLASSTGATADDDILWLTTDGYVGVVHQGSLFATYLGGSTGVANAVVDPTVSNRVWFLSTTGLWFRSATFDTSAHTIALGTTVAVPNAPSGMALGPAISPATGTWIYVSSNGGNWIRAWDLSMASKATLDWGSSSCYGPANLTFGPDGKLWYAQCSGGTPSCQYCSYSPATGAFQRVPIPTSAQGSGAMAVAAATPGTGSAVWALAINVGGVGKYQALQLAEGATVGATTSTMFSVNLDVGGDLGCGPLEVAPSVTASPAVSGHTAYLWWTTYQGMYRMQP